MKREPRTGADIVASWVAALWMKDPGWMKELPYQRDLDSLIADIDASLWQAKQKE